MKSVLLFCLISVVFSHDEFRTCGDVKTHYQQNNCCGADEHTTLQNVTTDGSRKYNECVRDGFLADCNCPLKLLEKVSELYYDNNTLPSTRRAQIAKNQSLYSMGGADEWKEQMESAADAARYALSALPTSSNQGANTDVDAFISEATAHATAAHAASQSASALFEAAKKGTSAVEAASTAVFAAVNGTNTTAENCAVASVVVGATDTVNSAMRLVATRNRAVDAKNRATEVSTLVGLTASTISSGVVQKSLLLDYATKDEIEMTFNHFLPNQIDKFNSFWEQIKDTSLTREILQRFLYANRWSTNIMEKVSDLLRDASFLNNSYNAEKCWDCCDDWETAKSTPHCHYSWERAYKNEDTKTNFAMTVGVITENALVHAYVKTLYANASYHSGNCWDCCDDWNTAKETPHCHHSWEILYDESGTPEAFSANVKAAAVQKAQAAKNETDHAIAYAVAFRNVAAEHAMNALDFSGTATMGTQPFVAEVIAQVSASSAASASALAASNIAKQYAADVAEAIGIAESAENTDNEVVVASDVAASAAAYATSAAIATAAASNRALRAQEAATEAESIAMARNAVTGELGLLGGSDD